MWAVVIMTETISNSIKPSSDSKLSDGKNTSDDVISTVGIRSSAEANFSEAINRSSSNRHPSSDLQPSDGIKPLWQKRRLCAFFKFMAALFIVNHHLFGLENPGSRWYSLFFVIPVCVPLFFFLAAYGVSHRLSVEGDGYLRKIVSRRLPMVLIPWVSANVVVIAVSYLCNGEFDWQRWISGLWCGEVCLLFSWFVTVLVTFYLLFALCMSLPLGKLWRMIALTVLIAAGGLWMRYGVDIGDWHYKPLGGLMLGVWYQHYETWLLKHLSNVRLNVVICVLAVATFVMNQLYCPNPFGLGGVDRFWIYVICFTLPNVALCLGVACLLRFKDYCPDWQLCNTYYEIYLLQNAARILLTPLDMSFVKYWILSYVIVLALALIVYRFDMRLFGIAGLGHHRIPAQQV